MCFICEGDEAELFPVPEGHAEEFVLVEIIYGEDAIRPRGQQPKYKGAVCKGCGKEKRYKTEDNDCNLCKDAIKIYSNAVNRMHYLKRKTLGLCNKCSKPAVNGTTSCEECSKKHSVSSINRNRYNRRKVFEHYGQVCVCCGEVDEVFLTIDHINGDGAEHRRIALGNMYSWLVRNNFPEGFQILCYNCNCAKDDGECCPHELKENYVRYTNRKFEPFVFAF